MLGERLRLLRRERGLTLRALADEVGVGFTYLSKIENDKLEPGHAPSSGLLSRLAKALQADESELLVIGSRIPPAIERRMRERPDVFLQLAKLDDQAMDKIAASIEELSNP